MTNVPAIDLDAPTLERIRADLRVAQATLDSMSAALGETPRTVQATRFEVLTDDGTVGAILTVEDQRDVADRNENVAPFVLMAEAPDAGGCVPVAELYV